MTNRFHTSNIGTYGIKRDILFVPLIFVVVVNAFDMYSSWFVINYLDIELIEANSLVATHEGKLDVKKGHIWKFFLILMQALLFYVVWKTRRTKYSKFENIKQVEDTCKLHSFLFSCAMAPISVIFFIAFFWNPLVFFSTVMDFHWSPPTILGIHQSSHPFSISWLLGILMAIYWQRSFLWRYLTDEAKKKHRCLQWPYRIGFMKDEIV